jgi:hypothetical protein
VVDGDARRVRLTVDHSVDLEKVLIEARSAGQVVWFDFDPPSLNEIFRERLRAGVHTRLWLSRCWHARTSKTTHSGVAWASISEAPDWRSLCGCQRPSPVRWRNRENAREKCSGSIGVLISLGR